MSDLNSILSTLLYVLGGVGAGGYAVWRKLKSDNTGDKVDAKTQRLIDNLQRELEIKTQDNHHKDSVIDRVAMERNTAVAQVGELKAKVSALTEQVGRMEKELVKLEQENQRLTLMVEQSTKVVSDMSLQVSQLMQMNMELTTKLKEVL